MTVLVTALANRSCVIQIAGCVPAIDIRASLEDRLTTKNLVAKDAGNNDGQRTRFHDGPTTLTRGKRAEPAFLSFCYVCCRLHGVSLVVRTAPSLSPMYICSDAHVNKMF